MLPPPNSPTYWISSPDRKNVEDESQHTLDESDLLWMAKMIPSSPGAYAKSEKDFRYDSQHPFSSPHSPQYRFSSPQSPLLLNSAQCPSDMNPPGRAGPASSSWIPLPPVVAPSSPMPKAPSFVVGDADRGQEVVAIKHLAPDLLLAYSCYPHEPQRAERTLQAPDARSLVRSEEAFYAPLPDEFYAHIACCPPKHFLDTPSVMVESGSLHLYLRNLQQHAARQNPRQALTGSGGTGKEAYTNEIERKLRDWNISYSSTVSPLESGEINVYGPYGDGKLRADKSRLSKIRDGYMCNFCCKSLSIETSHILKRAPQETRPLEWLHLLRASNVSPTFRKDLPCNGVTLCTDHHKSYDRSGFCYVPSAQDIEALIAYEIEDRKRRAQQHLMDPTKPYPSRSVPPPHMLSGWYEWIPLSLKETSYRVGPWRVTVAKGDTISYCSGGGSAWEQTPAFCLVVKPDPFEPRSPNMYHDSMSEEFLVWLGLSDLSPQAAIASAIQAFGGVCYELSPRHRFIKDRCTLLMSLYKDAQPPRKRPVDGKADEITIDLQDSPATTGCSQEVSSHIKSAWATIGPLLRDRPYPPLQLWETEQIRALADSGSDKEHFRQRMFQLQSPDSNTLYAKSAEVDRDSSSFGLANGQDVFKTWISYAQVEAEFAQQSHNKSLDPTLRNRILPSHSKAT